jgi:hypothetical protein
MNGDLTSGHVPFLKTRRNSAAYQDFLRVEIRSFKEDGAGGIALQEKPGSLDSANIPPRLA